MRLRQPRLQTYRLAIVRDGFGKPSLLLQQSREAEVRVRKVRVVAQRLEEARHRLLGIPLELDNAEVM